MAARQGVGGSSSSGGGGDGEGDGVVLFAIWPKISMIFKQQQPRHGLRAKSQQQGRQRQQRLLRTAYPYHLPPRGQCGWLLMTGRKLQEKTMRN